MGLPGQIQAYLREQMRLQRQTFAISAFTLYLNPKDIEDSWAIPDVSAAAISYDNIIELCAAFHEHNRVARIQWIDLVAPELKAQLSAQGFEPISDYPVMVCRSDKIIEPPAIADFTVDFYTSESSIEEIKAAWNANAAGFGEDVSATDEIAVEFRKRLTSARLFVARFEGQSVASGMFNDIRVGITELTGISTLPAFRHRGFAASLTASMTRTAFADGAQVAFLTAVSDDAARVYARIGYSTIARLLKYQES